jgi:hypothetical protein
MKMYVKPVLLSIKRIGNYLFFCLVIVMSSQVSAQQIASDKSLSNDSSSLKSSDIASDIEQIQKEVLKLNRELFILEEDLLFPANTQISVFVSVDIGRFFTLDSVELKINDQEAAGFLYTKRQRESLEQGGIQRLFKGNLKIGQHQLTAIFIGLDHEQRTVKRAITYQFEKEDEAVMIELKLQDNTKNLQAEVNVEEWSL